jgi:mono/diheme cytochrome c family protein
MRRLPVIAVSLLVLGLLGYSAFHYWRTRNISRVQRGWQVATAKGCFTCHGPGALRGMADPGHGLDEIPPLTRDMVTMYAENEGELREWILDGLPKRVRNDPKQMKLREGAVILMPAWRDVLSERELQDLLAFVKAATDFETPPEGPASEGLEVARKYGCFNCHGPQGRGSIPNVRAFKGYIPSWDGPDFMELSENDQETREWILAGRPQRLQKNRAARWFLDRQPIRMPAYQGHVTPAEVDRLVDYIHWVRQHPY